MAREEFVPPQSIEEAEERRQQLIQRIQEIQADLGNRNRTDPSGARIRSQDYWSWKKKAVDKLTILQTELRRVKQWITQHNNAERPHEPRPLETPIELLRDAYVLLYRLREEGVELNAEEEDVLDGLRDFLTNVKRESASPE